MGTRGKVDGLKQELSDRVETLDLSDSHKHFVRSRWMDQVLWMEGAAQRCGRRYHILRLLTIIGGVTVPALVSLNVAGDASDAVGWTVFGISLVVAMSASVEEFFHYGERWRHYRQTVEQLKSEGWLFMQLAGRYRRHGISHEAAYPAFAAQVERILQRDVESYVTEVVQEKEETEAKS